MVLGVFEDIHSGHGDVARVPCAEEKPEGIGHFGVCSS